MTKLTKQEQVEAVITAINNILFGGRGRPNSEPLGRDIAAYLNANGFEIVKKGGEDE